MTIYKLYLEPLYEATPNILLGKTRTRKGIGRLINKMKKELGYESIPYCRYWGTDEYQSVDFGCHSHLFLIKKEVI